MPARACCCYIHCVHHFLFSAGRGCPFIMNIELNAWLWCDNLAVVPHNPLLRAQRAKALESRATWSNGGIRAILRAVPAFGRVLHSILITKQARCLLPTTVRSNPVFALCGQFPRTRTAPPARPRRPLPCHGIIGKPRG